MHFIHITIFPLQSIKISSISPSRNWHYHPQLFNVPRASKCFKIAYNWLLLHLLPVVTHTHRQTHTHTHTHTHIHTHMCRVGKIFNEITRFKYFLLSFRCYCTFAFPLLYKVLHHLIFTNVHHFSLYRSSLYIHPEFSDGINYLLSVSLSHIFFCFLHYLTSCSI